MSSFFTYVFNGISLGSVYAIIALGYTMVYGIAKMLNFAHGDVIMIGGYVGGYIKSYMAQLSQKTARYNKFEKDTMYIKNCTYEKEASAVGAAMYFVDKYFNEL